MTDLVIPAALRFARSRFRPIAQVGLTRGIYTGAAQTTGFGGDRVGASLDFTPHGGRTTLGRSEGAQLRAFMMALRSAENRVYLGDNSSERRGAYPSAEMFANADFSNGTNLWTASGGALSVADGAARLTVSTVDGVSNPQFYQSVTIPTAYVPYALRSFIADGAQSSGLSIGPFAGDGTVASSDYSTTRGYRVAPVVFESAGAAQQFPAVIASLSGYTAGANISVPFVSLAPCSLADGGGNVLLQSDDLTNAAWTPAGLSSRTPNVGAAPDGTVSADRLTENSSAGTHSITQSVSRTPAIATYVGYGYFKRDSGTRNVRLWIGNDGLNGGTAIFNLSTGAVSSITNQGTGTKTRAFSVDAGNGWWLCFVVSRLPSAGTVAVFAEMENNAGSTSYTGNGTSSILAWRLGACPGSVPSRPTQTTTVAVAAASQPGASAIFVKGLPASTANLLYAGDWFEMDGQLKMAIAPLDSNAAGLGYLQFSPPARRAVSESMPIIVHRPMGRFLLPDANSGWENVPGVFSSGALDLEEAFS